MKEKLCSPHRRFLNVLALGFGLGALWSAPAAGAASITLSTGTPAARAGVQNLTFATSTGNTVVVPGNQGQSNYIAGDNGVAIGQTFTTGTNLPGYTLSTISVRQVGAYNTFFDYTGGNVSLQVFQLGTNVSTGVYSITPLVTETVAVGGTGGFSSGTLGANAHWLSFGLTAALPLNANTQYGFQITSDGTGGNSGFFLETDGTRTNPYAGGFALGTAKVNGSFDTGFVYDGANGQISDRAFVASMDEVSAVPEPSTLLGGMIVFGLMCWHLRGKLCSFWKLICLG